MTRLYKRIDAAARVWGAPLGVQGKRGSSYLYVNDEGRLTTYRPHFTGHRAVKGWSQLGYLLEDREILRPHWDPETRLFLGYEIVGCS